MHCKIRKWSSTRRKSITIRRQTIHQLQHRVLFPTLKGTFILWHFLNSCLVITGMTKTRSSMLTKNWIWKTLWKRRHWASLSRISTQMAELQILTNLNLNKYALLLKTDFHNIVVNDANLFFSLFETIHIDEPRAGLGRISIWMKACLINL